MYRSFFGLEKKPFQISSDPSFMWLGEKHKEALATLKYGILDNKGFLLLTGDVGTGKTTLINALIETLSDDVICTTVPDPQLEKLDFFNYIGAAFGIDKEFESKGIFLAYFRRFLTGAQKEGKKVLLIIDEAQLLTQELLEEIRLLSNIEHTHTKLINIFFIGQNEFNDILNQEQNRAVRQRLTLNYNIDPLTHEETCEYVKHRLAVAGTEQTVFDDSALHEIYIYSGGFPRRINVICDHCLLSGYVKEKKLIDARIVEECSKELLIPEQVGKNPVDGLNFAHEDALRQPTTPTQPVRQAAPMQPPVQPVYQAQPTPQFIERPRRNNNGIVFGLVVGIAFLLFAWFFMYPDHFIGSMSQFKSNLAQITSKFDQPQASVSKEESVSTPEKTVPKEPPQTSAPEKEKKTLQPTNLKADKKKPEPKPVNTQKVKPAPPVKDEAKPIPLAVPSQIKPIEQPVTAKPLTKKPSKPADTEIAAAATPSQPEVITKKIQLPLPTEKIIVRFKYNTNDFTQTGYDKLVEFSDILVTHPDTHVLITGYTDADGTRSYNQKLSEFRANIVRSFLLGRGINADQIAIQGLGSVNPIEDNNTAWGRMMNRRVEIEILKQ